MINATLDRGQLDRTLPAWSLVWSAVLTAAVFGILQGITSSELSDDSKVFLAMALGGLSASWLTIGTWILLIDLPQFEPTRPANEVTAQRVWPRVGMLLLWLTNVAAVAWVLWHRQDGDLLGEILIMASVGFMGPVILWQWTQRRIHRGTMPMDQKRSIRQILGLTFTVALVIAMLNVSRLLFETSNAFMTMVVTNGVFWALMLWILLGRWWWLIFVTIPVLLAQGIAVSSLIVAGRDADSEAAQLGGFSITFYLFSLLLLTLWRSGGHRWLRRKPKTAPYSPSTQPAAG